MINYMHRKSSLMKLRKKYFESAKKKIKKSGVTFEGFYFTECLIL